MVRCAPATDGGRQLADAGNLGVLFGQVPGDLADGGPLTDFAWRLSVGGQERERGLCGLAPLPPRPSHVGVESATSFRGGETGSGEGGARRGGRNQRRRGTSAHRRGRG